MSSGNNPREIDLEILEDGDVFFPNLFPEDYEMIEELGDYKDHVPIEGYEWLFRDHLCA